MDFQDPVVLGISASVLTTLIVQGIKKLGAPDRFGAWYAFGVAAVLVALGLVMNLYPESTQFITAGIAAVVVWLTSIGIYEKGRDVLGK
jgi:uncharacterized membrane protein YjjP (DUF1212 family)